jgi:hypothetical protein
MLVFLVGLTFLAKRTTFGRHVYAVGGNAEAARRSGINVARVRILVFMISGIMAGVGGIVLSARLQSVNLNVGGGTLLLDSISAAVIGGVSLFGGRGEVRGALLGSLFRWGVVGTAKPGATVLATAGTEQNSAQAGAPDKTNALVARHNYGFGRVLFVGLESTWRWRYKAGDTYHHRFWGQVIRWAASEKPLLTGNDFLRFGPRKPAVPHGQEVELVARLSDAARRGARHDGRAPLRCADAPEPLVRAPAF